MPNFMIFSLALLLTTPAYALKVKDDKVILEKLEDYSECQSRSYSGNICDTALRDWVSEHSADAFKAGKLTRRHMNAWGAIYFFDLAFKSKNGDCKDKDVLLAVESAANLPSSREEPISGMKRIVFDSCFAEMKDDLVKIVDSGGKSEKANLCPGLKANKVQISGCRRL